MLKCVVSADKVSDTRSPIKTKPKKTFFMSLN
jgi:hypothetical protein